MLQEEVTWVRRLAEGERRLLEVRGQRWIGPSSSLERKQTRGSCLSHDLRHLLTELLGLLLSLLHLPRDRFGKTGAHKSESTCLEAANVCLPPWLVKCGREAGN